MLCRVFSCLVFKFVFKVCIHTHTPIKIKSGPSKRLTLDVTEIRQEKVIIYPCITSSASVDVITEHHTLCYCFDPYNTPVGLLLDRAGVFMNITDRFVHLAA